MNAERKSPKLDALRAMREANWAEAMADVPKPLRRAAKPDELRALAKAAAERVGKDKPIKAPLSEPKRSPAQTASAETKRQKSRGRIAKMLAKKSGATAAMPLSGKAALAKIAEPETMETTMAKKTTKKAAKAKTKARKAATKAAATPTAAEGQKNDASALCKVTKSDLVHQMLTSAVGATRQELSTASGWAYVNLKMAAKRAKMKLVEADGRFRLV